MGVVSGSEELEERLVAARRRVEVQREALKDSRRRLREAHAKASVAVDASVAARLRSRGLIATPPIPSFPPDDPED